MSETKAAFAERTIRSSKNVLYRYVEVTWIQVHSRTV